MSSAGREVMAMRTPQGFAPWDDEASEQLKRIKVGSLVRIGVRVVRNALFHRKVMSLFKFAYDQWEPEINRESMRQYKSFDVFRHELTILAGHYTQYVSLLDNRLHLEAKSLSFAKMSEQEFEGVYRDLKRVVWDRIIANKGTYTERDFENVLAQLMEYDR